MFDFSEVKKFLQERSGTTDVAKVVSLSPSFGSDFTTDLSNATLIPKEKEATVSDEELQFLELCQKILHRLGFIKTSYEFSESVMNKSKHYYSMLLAEHRTPSLSCLHNVIKNMEVLNDNPATASKYLDDLIEKGNKLLTKRLLKYII